MNQCSCPRCSNDANLEEITMEITCFHCGYSRNEKGEVLALGVGHFKLNGTYAPSKVIIINEEELTQFKQWVKDNVSQLEKCIYSVYDNTLENDISIIDLLNCK